jgi:HAMP domain-containing protein
MDDERTRAPMTLRTKFNLVMLVAFVVGLGLAGVLSYGMVTANARREVLNEAAIMSGEASAISRYTADEIAPLLVGQFTRRFLPQSVPAWSAQTNFRTLQAQFPEYSYRTVMTNPTNPADLPADWQAAIIKTLVADPATKEVVTERDTDHGRILSVSRPIVITDPACLQCHSVPSNAPQTMVDLYGSANGFGWKLNEVLGAQIVSVPMQVPLERAWRTFATVMTGLTGVFAVMVVLLNVLLHFVIIRPVRQISAAATDVSLGNMDAPEYRVRGRDEISALGEAFNRMRRSLANALKMLGE